MKKDKLYFPILITILGIVCFHYSAKGQEGVKWSGKVSFYEKTTGTEGLLREWRMDAMITNDTGTAYHTSTWSSDHGSGRCNNQGKSELDVGIDDEKKTYRILAHVPGCIGTQTINGVESVYPVTDETGIAINDEPLGTNRNVLSGRTVTTDRSEHGTITTIYEWNLRSGPLDVELIVTPQNYDNWMPEPGADGEEWTPGDTMTVLLRLQKRGGGKPAVKAKFFELRLSETSREKGSSLNFPLPLFTLNPPAPDLSFLEQEDAALSGEDQFIRIPVEDGINGYVEIGSFDGGGWSDLIAVAILESGDSIKGNLIRTGGITKIPIPKRNAGSKIATAWLQANGSPGDSEDIEASYGGNTNLGDGLSAYEEYRGVFSEWQFRRLDPKKKELGVSLLPTEITLFSDGIGWLKKACGIEVVLFWPDEIDTDRRLNKNGSNAQIYKQYVLKINKGSLPGDKVGRAEGGPDIPEKVTQITVDVDKFNATYRVGSPYTLQDRIAKTVAHELSHGVNVWHHGPPNEEPDTTAYLASRPPFRIFRSNGSEITQRPKPLTDISRSGNQESGDLSCYMAYTNNSNWVYIGKINGSPVYYEVPRTSFGRTMCISKRGTDINDLANPANTGINGVHKYFGNAAAGDNRGNCLRQVKLK